MTKMDMNKMLQQVQQMQEEMAKAQDELAKEVVEARRERIELGAGSVIGELALLNADEKRTARVRAHTDVRGFALSRRDFTRLVEDHPKLALALLQVLAQRLSDTMTTHR